MSKTLTTSALMSSAIAASLLMAGAAYAAEPAQAKDATAPAKHKVEKAATKTADKPKTEKK